MRAAEIADQLTDVLVTEEQIRAKLDELARRVEADYDGKELLLVGVLKGAVMVMADFARSLSRPLTMDWMAVSSYGAGTKSSGVVQIRKDLDTDLTGKHVLIVEDIIDSGLTLAWLLENFASRGAASIEILALLRKPGRRRSRSTAVRRLRHPHRLRRRVRARLQRAVPEPPRRRSARAACTLLDTSRRGSRARGSPRHSITGGFAAALDHRWVRRGFGGA
jgi:hypoxanthine phosphoribosyltransferase